MNLRNQIEIIANVATTGLAILLVAVLAKGYFLPGARQQPPVVSEVREATLLKDRISGVDWSRNGRTLILPISTQCHFCKESTPFYRRLRAEIGRGLQTVVLLPQPVAAAETYLKEEGLQADQVQEVPLGKVGIRGTPTMLLVDSKGVVSNVWRGCLQTLEQERVLGVLKRGY